VAYAEAIRQGAPRAVQVSDRWHLWHGLAGAVEKTVIAPKRLLARASVRPGRAIDERTRARHAAVHDLLGQGVGLLECSRRLGWALNTVKRYARAATADQLRRPQRYGKTLVDLYRDHLRRRLAAEPDVPVTRLWPRSASGDTSAARACSCATSNKAVPTPIALLRRRAAWCPGS
jgi:hypothetical protein